MSQSHKSGYQKNIQHTIFTGILGNLFLVVVKGVTGFVGNSFALIADAIESLTDVFSSILLLVGVRYAQKPADKNHPYGHGKAEALIALIIGFVMLIAALYIAWQSFVNMQKPHSAPSWFTLPVLAVIIITKELLHRKFKNKSDATHSTALRAEAWHHRADVITSVAAFVGIFIAVIMGDAYAAADDMAAIIASGIILINAYNVVRPALREIMDEHRYPNLSEKVRNIAHNTPGVMATDKCHIRKHGAYYVVDLHVVVNGDFTVRQGHDISHAVQHNLHTQLPHIGHVVIHIEPFDENYNK
ncbi:MAG: cation diffusion facilitator family transporter [Weeksellaceae bacterium]|nr:cation diffusion facilitator family transporter [Weeksellaceae bacterium]